MKANRKRKTAPGKGRVPQKKPMIDPSTDPDDLLNALVERDRANMERLFASVAADDERVRRLLDDIARDQGPDIIAMIAAEQAETDRALAAMIGADEERIARLLSQGTRA